MRRAGPEYQRIGPQGPRATEMVQLTEDSIDILIVRHPKLVDPRHLCCRSDPFAKNKIVSTIELSSQLKY